MPWIRIEDPNKEETEKLRCYQGICEYCGGKTVFHRSLSDPIPYYDDPNHTDPFKCILSLRERLEEPK